MRYWISFDDKIRLANSVVTGGPYRLVRHPSYAGAIWAYLAFPFMLDALWALVLAALLTVALVVRTGRETAPCARNCLATRNTPEGRATGCSQEFGKGELA